MRAYASAFAWESAFDPHHLGHQGSFSTSTNGQLLGLQLAAYQLIVLLTHPAASRALTPALVYGPLKSSSTFTPAFVKLRTVLPPTVESRRTRPTAFLMSATPLVPKLPALR